MKKIVSLILLFFLIILAQSRMVCASNLNYSMEYSEAYLNWLKLSDNEKKHVPMPRMYNVNNVFVKSKNPIVQANMLTSSLAPSFNLNSVIPNNLQIRDQQNTGICWALASLSSLETNLALANYKNKTNTSKVYDFSERHMEYATSKNFLNNKTNPIGYNRNVGDGANWQVAASYLTNGYGAVDEKDMPFKNNENIIDISEIQNKKVISQVYDTVEFGNYNKASSNDKTNIMNQIKNHIQNYGSVFAIVHASSTSKGCYNVQTAAQYCNDASTHQITHGISIIGWDDNYDLDNFNTKPSSNGAWIVRDSWGEESGDNGLIYISYEDCNISSGLYGIVKASDKTDYDNIYFYDDYSFYLSFAYGSNNSLMLCNIFDKKTNDKEYLTQVSLYTPATCTCKVYVNANGTGKGKNDLQFVPLKEGDSETINAGYHTLEFSNPVTIDANANNFTVVIEVSSLSSASPYISMEVPNNYANATIETGKCFIATGNDLENSNWLDLGRLSETFSNFKNGDSTIKAFTKLSLVDKSLKDIEITTPPDKTTYYEGENFDPAGMEITVNYNDGSSRVLSSSEYSISNASNLKTSQNSVTISYENQNVEQEIEVLENNIESISITTPPTKTEYYAGDDFNTSGMVVKATYTDGTSKTITDYTITNGSNLKNGQTSVTISYADKTVTQTITVKEILITKIEITKAPNKTNYIVGQNFDSTGMVVKATYSNGTVKEITDYEIENGDNLSKNQSSVTISYEGFSAQQRINVEEVEEKSVSKITIKTLPTKTTYIQDKENLTLTGGVIEVQYSDGSKEDVLMTSNNVTVLGFDNTELGTITLELTYGSKTVNFDVEIIAEEIEEKAENSDLSSATNDVKKVSAYFYTKGTKEDYLIIDISLNNIKRILNNDKLEYYYCLSSSNNEKDIDNENWVKVEGETGNNNSLDFTIDTRDIKNFDEISTANVLYLYVKEVAFKGGNQSVATSKALKVDSEAEEMDIYIDDLKQDFELPDYDIDDVIPDTPKYQGDDTLANKIIPYAGNRLIIVTAIIILLGTGIFLYIKYKRLNKYIK